MNEKHIVIYDGVCNFCNNSVNFIIQRDPNDKFLFTPMQSELADALIKKHNIDNVGIDTFLLIKNEKCYIWTNAALEITKDLSGYWHLFRSLKIIPRPIRDSIYRTFARNRYKLFGRTEKCVVPTDEIRSKFIGI